ncbi:MAG: hypothetical protein HZY76_01305 [Anaerolineae bacterium]|nr:MAG: hypothetical protein HZY76_01305 [Anaerolineae bacterium]
MYLALLFAGFWGYFGWLQLPLPLPVYAVLAVVSGLAVVGVALRGVQWRRWSLAERAAWRFHVRVAQWAVLAVVLAGLTVLIPLIVWGWQPQARYLYPVLIPVVLLGVVGLRYWSRRGACAMAWPGTWVAFCYSIFILCWRLSGQPTSTDERLEQSDVQHPIPSTQRRRPRRGALLSIPVTCSSPTCSKQRWALSCWASWPVTSARPVLGAMVT